MEEPEGGVVCGGEGVGAVLADEGVRVLVPELVHVVAVLGDGRGADDLGRVGVREHADAGLLVEVALEAARVGLEAETVFWVDHLEGHRAETDGEVDEGARRDAATASPWGLGEREVGLHETGEDGFVWAVVVLEVDAVSAERGHRAVPDLGLGRGLGEARVVPVGEP